mmetsp:Transcript_77332/g.149335  ORF Transcript_77332/g.149335 Transcript_77332/m.149335 type:complete len:94 (-) Transcript_77332:92-373(-)
MSSPLVTGVMCFPDLFDDFKVSSTHRKLPMGSCDAKDGALVNIIEGATNPLTKEQFFHVSRCQTVFGNGLAGRLLCGVAEVSGLSHAHVADGN